MRVIVSASATTAERTVADVIADTVRAAPACVLGLATGRTPTPVYACLREMIEADQLVLAGTTCFNLDEFVGLASTEPQSFAAYMERHLFAASNIEPDRTHIPRGDAAEPNAEATAYEDLICRLGPIDLQLLGLGANGHIGFNEPGTALDSVTHVVTLTQQTRRVFAEEFDGAGNVPTHGITMGLVTILNARQIVLLAVGEAKAEAVKAMVEGPVTPDIPASVLQRHPDVTVILDPASAALLRH